MMNPADLKPYRKNAKLHDEAQIKNVAESLKKYGFRQPIVVDKDNVIIIGHCRQLAALRLGLEEVPVEVADDLTAKQVKELRLLDNKTNESEWAYDLLAQELKGLDLEGFDIDWGIPELIEPEPEIEEDDYEIDGTAPTRSKPGQVWKLGEHRVMCGSATDARDMAKLMKGRQADLLLTDPPYGVEYEGSTGMTIENDDMRGEEFIRFLTEAFEAADSVMKPGAAFYIWHANSKGYEFMTACHNAGWTLRQVIIWVKNEHVLGRQDYQWKHESCLYGWKEGAGHYFTDSRSEVTTIEDDLEIDLETMKKEDMKALLQKILADSVPTSVIRENKPKKNDLHPTMKPIKLVGRLVKNSTKPGQLVLDSFGGSGSTMMACEQLGRTCYTMDIDPVYVDAMLDRWESYTGEQAELIEE